MDTGKFIVGIGGTTRPNSTSERILRAALGRFSEKGAHTVMFSGRSLLLPIYEPGIATTNSPASLMLDTIRRCDGLIIASPGYHGSVSGMIKNALDYVEELREDSRPYLHGRPVGCIACAQGWQAAVSTLGALRAITHALRGWPTPMGIAINTGADSADPKALETQLDLVCGQILDFECRDRGPERALA
jgi:FMN reductase